MKNKLREEKGIMLGTVILGVIVLLVIVSIVIGIAGFKLDFASGSHRITPTAIDRDMWGNYKVYYKTSEYTKNSDEDYYYIDKDNTELVEEVKECIKDGQTIIAYYDEYVGWKGISAPNNSPITSIEIIEN